jgi:microcystin-dependent protein
VSEPYLGQITIFAGNFAPRGWALCEGQSLSIVQNTALFSILGTQYGGDGRVTFNLPDLRGRAPIGPDQGPGLSQYVIGQQGGSEAVTLNTNQLPAHTHVTQGSFSEETTNHPAGAAPAVGGVYGTGSFQDMTPTNATGGNQGHENRPPYLAIYYIIALEGIFPSRN